MMKSWGSSIPRKWLRELHIRPGDIQETEEEMRLGRHRAGKLPEIERLDCGKIVSIMLLLKICYFHGVRE